MGSVTKTFLHTAAVFLLVISAYAQEGKENYAVMTLKNGEGVTEGEASIITDRLRSELFKTDKVNMMERDQMQNILKEQGFQQSGACTDQACMVEMGQLLGVSKLISGSIGKLGSMFLLNFRTIDVQTARITKAVSHDITGGIEDVVKELPVIASHLAGIKEAPDTAQALKIKTAEPTEQYLEGKEEKKIHPSENEKKPAGPDKKKDSAENRNRNRSGLKLAISLFPGEADMEVDHAGLNGFTQLNDSNSLHLDEEDFFLLKINAEFIIRLGSLFNLNIGPGFHLYHKHGETNETVWDPDLMQSVENNYEQNFFIYSPSLLMAFNFPKRFYPVKLNFGVISEFSLNIYKYEFSDFVDPFYDEEHIGFTPGISVGGRLGIEFLMGNSFSLGVDANMIFSRITFNNVEITSSSVWETPEDFALRFTMPPFGLTASMNFYF